MTFREFIRAYIGDTNKMAEVLDVHAHTAYGYINDPLQMRVVHLTILSEKSGVESPEIMRNIEEQVAVDKKAEELRNSVTNDNN